MANAYLSPISAEDDDGTPEVTYILVCEQHKGLIERITAIVDMGKKRRSGWCAKCIWGNGDDGDGD